MVKKIELITPDDLEKRLENYLNQRRMPDYFLYIGNSGVKNWLALESSNEFPVASGLTDFLRQCAPQLAEHLSKGLNLVSIGVGDGQKEHILLEYLIRKDVSVYYAVDISSRMVDEALHTVADIRMEKIGLVALLEDLPVMKKIWESPIFLCLLGNNFCNYRPDFLLKTIHNQLEPKEYFLFDCRLFSDEGKGEKCEKNKIEQIYRSEQNVGFNIGPLVDRGMGPDHCVFHLDLISEKTEHGLVYRTHKWLQIIKDTVISCGKQKVFLPKGDTIQLGFTYKYTYSQVKDFIKEYGFEEIKLFHSNDHQHLIALVKKQ